MKESYILKIPFVHNGTDENLFETFKGGNIISFEENIKKTGLFIVGHYFESIDLDNEKGLDIQVYEYLTKNGKGFFYELLSKDKEFISNDLKIMCSFLKSKEFIFCKVKVGLGHTEYLKNALHTLDYKPTVINSEDFIKEVIIDEKEKKGYIITEVDKLNPKLLSELIQKLTFLNSKSIRYILTYSDEDFLNHTATYNSIIL